MTALPKLARVACLALTLAGCSLATATLSEAQEKGTTKKTKKVDGRVEIREGKDGKFRFMIYSGKKFLGMSAAGGFKSYEDAEEAFADFKAIVAAVEKPEVGKKVTTDDAKETKAKLKKADK